MMGIRDQGSEGGGQRAGGGDRKPLPPSDLSPATPTPRAGTRAAPPPLMRRGGMLSSIGGASGKWVLVRHRTCIRRRGGGGCSLPRGEWSFQGQRLARIIVAPLWGGG